jgi:hypothetical protein
MYACSNCNEILTFTKHMLYYVYRSHTHNRRYTLSVDSTPVTQVLLLTFTARHLSNALS